MKQREPDTENEDTTEKVVVQWLLNSCNS
jgi:hypothetical protein